MVYSSTLYSDLNLCSPLQTRICSHFPVTIQQRMQIQGAQMGQMGQMNPNTQQRMMRPDALAQSTYVWDFNDFSVIKSKYGVEELSN